jgi:hypothetical protein
MQDTEDFIAKYGLTQEEYDAGLSSLYNTDAYKTKFDEYKTSRDADWIKKQNQLLLEFDDE